MHERVSEEQRPAQHASTAGPAVLAATTLPRDAGAVLALQRTAGNRAVGRLLRSGRGLDGKPSNPSASGEEEIEGHEEARTRLARAVAQRRSLQRLSITQHKFTKGTCGERNIQWVFSLDNNAPDDGYIVQHIEGSEDIAGCPGPRSGTMTPTLNFYEAWLVRKGKKVDWTTVRDNWTDGSTRAPTPGKTGLQVTNGTLKFFLKSTTGDLGDMDTAPATAGSAWGPGKVSTSGGLPSTPTKPSWWDNAPVEGPVTRQAKSDWNCCDPDATKHTSNVTALPVPAAPAPAPAPARAPSNAVWYKPWTWLD